jgi:hypothetical protein
MQVFAMNEWFRGQLLRRIYRLNLTRLFEDIEVDWQKVDGRKSAIGRAIMLCADISKSKRSMFLPAKPN